MHNDGGISLFSLHGKAYMPIAKCFKKRRREIIIGPLLKDTSAESSLAYLEYAKDVYAYFVDLENKACNNELINP